VVRRRRASDTRQRGPRRRDRDGSDDVAPRSGSSGSLA
jgi:hypothetical protein